MATPHPGSIAHNAPRPAWQDALARWDESRIALASYRNAGPETLDSLDFKAWLADSRYWLSEYHRDVAARLDSWAPEEAQFVRFFADLVISRPEEFLFHESSSIATQFPPSEGEDAIYILATEIAHRAMRPQQGWVHRFLGIHPEQRGRQRLHPLLAKYALRMPTLYAVLFNSDAGDASELGRRAIFVRQGFAPEQFARIAEQELTPIQHLAEQGHEVALRSAIRELPLRLLWHQVPGISMDHPVDSGTWHAYTLAMAAYSADPLPLEQFSWHAAMILEKVAGLLRTPWEGHPDEVMMAIGHWLAGYQAVAHAAYAGRRTDYRQLYAVYQRLIGSI